MPGFSGLTALAGVRSVDRRMPFVLITAYGDETIREKALELGADAIFDKPFDIDDLRTAVCNIIPLA
jgi:DNA-binding response OmpR family regulator